MLLYFLHGTQVRIYVFFDLFCDEIVFTSKSGRLYTAVITNYVMI